MGNNKIIGAKIKNIRESKQLSIEEVAERSGLGIEQIERIEVTWISIFGPSYQNSTGIRDTFGYILG